MISNDRAAPSAARDPGAGRRRTFASDLSTAPNLITLCRLLLILVAAGLFFRGHAALGIVLAIVAGVTDYLDGWLARRTGQVTRLGEMLDQFADVFYESTVLIIAIAQFHFLPLWVLPVYLARELWVNTIRRFMAGHQMNIGTNFLGKLKTNFVMWGFLPTFLSIEGTWPDLQPWISLLGQASIGLGIAFGYASSWNYTRQLMNAYDRISEARVDGTSEPPRPPG